MLQMAPDDVTQDDKRDVVAELANMVGGNFKSLLPGPVFLSLPTVVAGDHLALQVPGAALVEDIPLQCEAGPFRVRLFAQVTDE
jgi:chemotaxis protein CheX